MKMRVFIDNQEHVGNKARASWNLAIAIPIVMKANQEAVLDK